MIWKMPYVVMRIESNNPDDIEVIDRMILTFVYIVAKVIMKKRM